MGERAEIESILEREIPDDDAPPTKKQMSLLLSRLERIAVALETMAAKLR